MGITPLIWNYEKKILKKIGYNYNKLVWCELGNQHTSDKKVAKYIYEKLGVDHTSIDINGRDGAIQLNLDYPVPECLINKFDVVTNYGTIEHINNQFFAFKNIHDMCKVNGVMIHVMPLINNWPNHCRYYYSKIFLIELAKKCNYEIIDLTILNTNEFIYPYNMISAAFIKKTDKFISNKDFYSIPGILDTKDTRRTGDYTRGKKKILK